MLSKASSESEKVQPRRQWTKVIAGLVGVLCMVALALGLGLGLGLKHKHTSSSSSNNSSSGRIKTILQDQLVDPSQFVLSSAFNVSAEPQARVYNWTISEIYANPTGTWKNMLVVNEISPGPTIEANLGDNIIVQVTNTLPNATSIHWHGQNQNGTNFMDGTYGITECGIAPGSTFTYNWTVQNVGTYWWHAHYSTQYSDGIVGALILHSPNDTLAFSNASTLSTTTSSSSSSLATRSTSASSSNSSTMITYDADLIFVVGDVYNQLSSIVLQTYVSPNGPDGNLGDEPVPDGGTINGVGQSNCAFAPEGTTCDGGVNYNFTVEANKRYRMRVINAGSFADILFSVDGHALTVVEADATAIEPTVVQSVQVSIAQRYSVIIETNQTAGAFYVHADLVTDMFTYTNAATVATQTAIMRYAGISNTTMPSSNVPALKGVAQLLDSTALVPFVPITPPNATKTEYVYMTLQLTSSNTWGGFWNDTAWSPETGGNATVFQTADAVLAGSSFADTDGSQFVITNNDIEVFDLIINNQDDGDHPIHLHGHTPYLVAAGDGNLFPGERNITAVNPMRRDVFVIPAYTYQVIRFVTDNPGLWAIHCHITWHMEAGLLMQISSLPSRVAQFDFPKDMKDQCNAAR